MRLKSFPLAIIILVVLFGSIGATTAMGWWQTETSKIPAVYAEGEAAGQFNPADIRGSYTFGDINKNFGVPVDELQKAFRVPDGGDMTAFQVKSLEGLYTDLPVEMGTGAVRLFTAFYKGLPYDLEANAETYLFPEAAAILQENGKMTADQLSFLSNHTLTQDGQMPGEPAASPSLENTPTSAIDATAPSVSSTEHVQPAGTITGKTTFQQLLDWGMKPEVIESILGGPMPDTGMIVKDFVASKGMDFPTLKTKLQTELDKLK